jgi:hypothetical protein
VPGAGRVGEIDRNLRVLDPACRAGVLALHRRGAAALLKVARLIDHEHRVLAAQALGHVAAQVIADLVSVPGGAGQQVLQPARRGMPGLLSDRPAVLARKLRHQPQHQVPGMPPRLHPGEPPGDPAHQPVEMRPPPFGVYAVARGHRKIIKSRHNPR